MTRLATCRPGSISFWFTVALAQTRRKARRERDGRRRTLSAGSDRGALLACPLMKWTVWAAPPQLQAVCCKELRTPFTPSLLAGPSTSSLTYQTSIIIPNKCTVRSRHISLRIYWWNKFHDAAFSIILIKTRQNWLRTNLNRSSSIIKKKGVISIKRNDTTMGINPYNIFTVYIFFSLNM